MKLDLEEIQQRINQNLPLHSEPQPNEKPCASESLSSDHPIWELWQRMGEMYGHQWHSQQGDEPNDTWAQGLADISGEQFAAGFRSLLGRSETWPPNLAEFRQLCTGHDPQAWERQAHKPYVSSLRLEDKTAKEKRGEYNKEQMRKLREETGL